MKVYSNIPEVLKRLLDVRAAITTSSAPEFSDALFAALNTGRGLMKRRIFNNGEDAEGKSLGNYHGNKTRLTKKKYSAKNDDAEEEKQRKKVKRNFNQALKENADEKYTEYEKKRLGHGRQIIIKDLQFGDSLINSIETVKQENRVVIAITNNENAKIAKYQEQQIGNIRAGLNANTGKAAPAKIFGLSETEFIAVKEQGYKLIQQVIINKMKG